MEMYEFDRANYNGKLQDLKREEERLEKYLQENRNALASYEINRIEHTLTGLKSEEQQISMLMDGGFY
jgi:hypothetical protein